MARSSSRAKQLATKEGRTSGPVSTASQTTFEQHFTLAAEARGADGGRRRVPPRRLQGSARREGRRTKPREKVSIEAKK